jgi:hypothetical protein
MFYCIISESVYFIIKVEKKISADCSPDRNENRRGKKPIGMDSGKLKLKKGIINRLVISKVLLRYNTGV